MIRKCTLPLLLLLLVAAPAGADEVKTLAGKTLTGTLERITDKDIVINGQATPIAQVLDVTLRTGRTLPALEKYIEVQLADDSLVRCTKTTLSPKDAQLLLTTGATVKVPISGVLTVLRDAQDAGLQKQWGALVKSKRRADRIFILRDGNLNPIDGAFGAIDEAKQSIKFKPETAPEIEPTVDKLQAMQFAKTDTPAETGLCKVYDIDGNLLIGVKLTYEAGLFTVTTPFGQKATFDAKLIARIDFNLGRLTYLSDLEEKSNVSPFLGGFKPLITDKSDRTKDAPPKMVFGKPYARWISSLGGAAYDYNLGGKYKKLSAVLGFDDTEIAESGPPRKVTVSIYADREKRFSQEVSLKAPIPINLDIRDVNTLRIEVVGPDLQGFGGHAVLANPHVSQ